MLWILIIIIWLAFLLIPLIFFYFIGLKIAVTRYSKIIFYGSLFFTIVGLIFNLMLISYQISFVNNSIDTLLICSFPASVIYLGAYGITKDNILKEIRGLIYIITASAFIFLFVFFYPHKIMAIVEVKSPDSITEIGSFIIREDGYIYGFMDYGSQFIVTRKVAPREIFERLVGVADNVHHYYGDKKHSITIDSLKKRIIVIEDGKVDSLRYRNY